ncbi:NAD-dependent deacylase [Deinococcus metallilatus]|uniref:NAD-dependent protein deacylase n=1 Tax=Deinococcus metallilatus TaxID=1211322 RepID=A0AAJ5JYU8_9DEIO|nr:NAD-dependent deacylase [Deinococcus metallilatus]MBB5297101.1 NAD-dependent deacetylase [Deinococcus metallilatus]QBY07793.1 NAD-dependent deacylase [Deinococcus metallilatus]RXJ13493.1 NAD-dependent deacylase [Deinococcus metallilatus]TLK22350.1 NAD-dependent deacylase [Deinococcus metallilatus]GMA17354.1 NAD-dependent protein deacylase [Deinococcus metallilatus]
MKLEEARAALRKARRVAVLTGAGVSAESGIPTFRDAQTGHWARFRPEDLASPEAYRRDPETVWQWYAGRYADVTRAQPNEAHIRLAELEREKGEGFFLATQNVDGLHARAGSERLVELHGNLTSARCEECGTVTSLPAPDTFTPPPACPTCGARMRPNIVWFGEYLPEDALEAATRAFQEADVALIVGTSGVVYPAAGLAFETRRGGGAVIEVNPEETELTPYMDYSVREVASKGLAALLDS